MLQDGPGLGVLAELVPELICQREKQCDVDFLILGDCLENVIAVALGLFRLVEETVVIREFSRPGNATAGEGLEIEFQRLNFLCPGEPARARTCANPIGNESLTRPKPGRLAEVGGPDRRIRRRCPLSGMTALSVSS